MYKIFQTAHTLQKESEVWAVFMKKWDLHDLKSIIKYIIYVASVSMACYGFWGCLFPELTLVKGTYRVVSMQESSRDVYIAAEGNVAEQMDAERLYADILDGKVTVTYRSRLWDIIKNKCGLEDDGVGF